MYKRLTGFPIRSGMTKESIFVDGQRGIVLIFTTIMTKYGIISHYNLQLKLI